MLHTKKYIYIYKAEMYVNKAQSINCNTNIGGIMVLCYGIMHIHKTPTNHSGNDNLYQYFIYLIVLTLFCPCYN